jgi:hypothetical protein
MVSNRRRAPPRRTGQDRSTQATALQGGPSGLATGKNKDTWRHHELIAKAIFEALLKQTGSAEWEIKHNVKVVGRSTDHQVDVYWRFRMADLEHIVIVQIKKEKGRVKQGDLMLFRDVLSDIPGQPKGVFISQTGYQKGALKVARSSGITIFELREIERQNQPITMSHFSIGKGWVRTDILAMEFTVLRPTLKNVRFTTDRQWVDQHAEAWPITTEPTNFNMAEFIDASGDVRTSMRKLVHDCVLKVGDAGRTQLDIAFSEPTYLVGVKVVSKAGNPVQKLPVVKVRADLDISKTTTVHPFVRDSDVTYILKNLIENHTRFVLITQDAEEPRAQVGVERAG